MNPGKLYSEYTKADCFGAKSLVRSLPDPAILRLLDVSMEEMVLFEVNNPQRHLVQHQDYREYLHSFLLTQYGLPALANSYIEQIIRRVQEEAQKSSNSYANILMKVLQAETKDAQPELAGIE